MIQVGTILKVCDKTGVSLVKCVKVFGPIKKRIAIIGDTILVSVKHINPKKFLKMKLFKRKRFFKGTLHRGLIVRSKKNYKRSNNVFIKFNENAVVLVNKTMVVLWALPLSYWLFFLFLWYFILLLMTDLKDFKKKYKNLKKSFLERKKTRLDFNMFLFLIIIYINLWLVIDYFNYFDFLSWFPPVYQYFLDIFLTYLDIVVDYLFKPELYPNALVEQFDIFKKFKRLLKEMWHEILKFLKEVKFPS